MNLRRKIGLLCVPAIALASLSCVPARAQDPVTVPIATDVALPIVVKALQPKPSGLAKFEGTVRSANNAQITVRAKGDDMSIQTFTLSPEASTKMQQIVDKGGYQWGDKVTVLYDPKTRKAIKVKGKPSKPL
jgi:hypothetical protein